LSGHAQRTEPAISPFAGRHWPRRDGQSAPTVRRCADRTGPSAAHLESIASGPLDEVFDYASTTKDVDYAKYFALAGLDVRFTSNDAPGSSIGLNTQLHESKLVVVGTSTGSPAESAGLKEADVVLEVDGIPATAKALNDMLAGKHAGDTARLKISRNTAPLEIEIVLGTNSDRKYEVLPLTNPSTLQSAIHRDWLRNSQ